MKIKIRVEFLLTLLALILAFFFFYQFFPKVPFRVDCNKDLKNYDMLFVYLRSCPHCHEDLLRMKELGPLEKIYMVDVGDKSCEKIINEYADYIIYHKNAIPSNIPPGIFTPTKVCLHNNLTYIGEMTKEQLNEFFNKCVGK